MTEGVTGSMSLEAWMNERANQKFQERLEVCLERFAKPDSAKPTSLTVREIAKRWGSMTPGGRLVLNRRLIEAPIECIDYVITHELCHRLVPNHSKHFWGTLTKAMPDWAARKAKLEAVAT